GYRSVVVAAQQLDPDSLLGWVARAIRIRAQCSEFGKGTWRVLGTRDRSVLAIRYSLGRREVVAVHNLSPEPRSVTLRLDRAGDRLVAVFSDEPARAGRTRTPIELAGYGY